MSSTRMMATTTTRPESKNPDTRLKTDNGDTSSVIFCSHRTLSGDDALLREFVDTFLYFLFCRSSDPPGLYSPIESHRRLRDDIRLSVGPHSLRPRERERVTLSDIIKSSDLNNKIQKSNKQDEIF